MSTAITSSRAKEWSLKDETIIPILELWLKGKRKTSEQSAEEARWIEPGQMQQVVDLLKEKNLKDKDKHLVDFWPDMSISGDKYTKSIHASVGSLKTFVWHVKQYP